MQQPLTGIDGLYSEVFHWDVTAAAVADQPSTACARDQRRPASALDGREDLLDRRWVSPCAWHDCRAGAGTAAPCVSPVDSGSVRSYEGMFAAAEGRLAAAREVSPPATRPIPHCIALADRTDRAIHGPLRIRHGYFGSGGGAHGRSGQPLAALEVPTDFAELAPLLADVARRAGALVESLNWLEGIVFRFEIPEARPDIDEIRADHARAAGPPPPAGVTRRESQPSARVPLRTCHSRRPFAPAGRILAPGSGPVLGGQVTTGTQSAKTQLVKSSPIGLHPPRRSPPSSASRRTRHGSVVTHGTASSRREVPAGLTGE